MPKAALAKFCNAARRLSEKSPSRNAEATELENVDSTSALRMDRMLERISMITNRASTPERRGEVMRHTRRSACQSFLATQW